MRYLICGNGGRKWIMFEMMALYAEPKLPLKHPALDPVRYRMMPARAVRLSGKSRGGQFCCDWIELHRKNGARPDILEAFKAALRDDMRVIWIS